MLAYAYGGQHFPHAEYGVDLDKVPDTYVEPFVAYRAWNWDASGITSLNNARWLPKVAFEATCKKFMALAAPLSFDDEISPHPVPDPLCSCGMYAGINMKHLIDIGYVQRGLHGEVSLWGRLFRHTLGWRAQFAYPKNFIVPANMIPHRMDEAKQRLDALTEFGVDIYIQPEREAEVGQVNIPLWIADYGYSTQGLSWLVEKRAAWYSDNPNVHKIAVGDRIAVFASGGGIGIVKAIDDVDVHYTMFAPDKIYRKPIKSIQWSQSNWRWETTGVGSVRGV